MPKQALKVIDPVGPGGLQNVYYPGITSDGLNPMDLIARRILAYKFSGTHVDELARQAMRDIETVACAVVGAGTLLVSHNHRYGNRVTNETNVGLAARQVWRELQAEGFTNITGYLVIHPAGVRRTSFHAEMQILEYCGTNNAPIQGAVIGVSKPCCKKCSTVLKIFKIDYSYFAGPPEGEWLGPDINVVPRTDRPAL